MMRAWVVLVVWSLCTGCASLPVQPEAYDAYRTGLALFNRGQYDTALGQLRQAVSIEPEFPQANLYLGRTYVYLRRWPEAVGALRIALRLAPEDTRNVVVDLLIDALLGVATTAFQRGDWPTALGALRDLMTLAPGLPQAVTQMVAALLAYGEQLVSAGAIQEAMATYREALLLNPHSSQATRQLVAVLLTSGKHLLDQGRAFEATTAYEEATHLAPDYLEAHLGLVRALLQNGEVESAFLALQEAVRLAPTSPEVIRLFRQFRQR